MIILDTNVLSAMMLDSPPMAVSQWLDQQRSSSLWVTSISLYEIHSGLALLPDGRRRSALQEAFDAMLAELLQNRVLDFDAHAAREAAGLTARRQRAGLVIDIQDTQIAGIAAARRAAIATRNVRHFRDVGVPVVNPWTD